jgi:hypothetical protein
MVTIPRSCLRYVVPVVAAIVLACPTSARGERIDIHDPSLLGPVLVSQDLNGRFFDRYLAHWMAEVRYAAGVYSYVYAIQTSPSFPEHENLLIDFRVGAPGHPLKTAIRWGAIHGSDEAWPHDGIPPRQTNEVAQMRVTPVDDPSTPVREDSYFYAAPVFAPELTYTVVYVQSLRPPAFDGVLEYHAYGSRLDGSPVNGYSYRDDVLVPTPEPATIVLFGLGLATVAAQRRANSRRLRGRTR